MSDSNVLDLAGAEMPKGPVVANAETVNVDQPRTTIPHVKIVAWVTFLVLLGFAVVTGLVLAREADATIKGALIGTWSTLAVSAVTFWVGASSGGKLSK